MMLSLIKGSADHNINSTKCFIGRAGASLPSRTTSAKIFVCHDNAVYNVHVCATGKRKLT